MYSQKAVLSFFSLMMRFVAHSHEIDQWQTTIFQSIPDEQNQVPS